MFRFTGRPALHVEVIWFQYQLPILKDVDIFDDLAAVDLPDEWDFITLKKANVHGSFEYLFREMKIPIYSLCWF